MSTPMCPPPARPTRASRPRWTTDRKSTRLNSSHLVISYAVFCLKKKKNHRLHPLISHPSLAPLPLFNLHGTRSLHVTVTTVQAHPHAQEFRFCDSGYLAPHHTIQ